MGLTGQGNPSAGGAGAPPDLAPTQGWTVAVHGAPGGAARALFMNHKHRQYSFDVPGTKGGAPFYWDGRRVRLLPVPLGAQPRALYRPTHDLD